MKNDNIHSFFFAVLVANFEFAGFAPKQKYTGWTVSVETVRTAKSWPRKNQSDHRDCLRLGLPYNNTGYFSLIHFFVVVVVSKLDCGLTYSLEQKVTSFVLLSRKCNPNSKRPGMKTTGMMLNPSCLMVLVVQFYPWFKFLYFFLIHYHTLPYT